MNPVVGTLSRTAEGGNEYTAWLLLSHLGRVGLVTRFKFQPFNLADYGGPKGFPDLLVELVNGALLVVEVKSSKFITDQFIETYGERELLLKGMGLTCVLWSDAKAASAMPVLTRNVRNNLCDMDRCKDMQLSHDLLEKLCGLTAESPISLAALLDASGAHWDEVMCALAVNHLSIRFEEPSNETSLIYTPASARSYEHYFSQGPGSQSWWRSLPNLDLDDCQRSA